VSDPDYSPAYQDEYQRLWHEAAARAEAAEAERDEWKQAASGRTVSCSNCETTEAEIVRLREALTEAKAQIGHGAFCNCVVCSPLLAALAAPDTEETR